MKTLICFVLFYTRLFTFSVLPHILANCHAGNHLLHSFFLPVFLVTVEFSFELKDLTWKTKEKNKGTYFTYKILYNSGTPASLDNNINTKERGQEVCFSRIMSHFGAYSKYFLFAIQFFEGETHMTALLVSFLYTMRWWWIKEITHDEWVGIGLNVVLSQLVRLSSACFWKIQTQKNCSSC